MEFRCLGTFDPPNCPLCRKPFLAERIKKLHVDKPDPDEVLYLTQMILGWEMSEEDLVSMLGEIEVWLDRKDSEEVSVLHKALFGTSCYWALGVSLSRIYADLRVWCYSARFCEGL